MKTRKTGHSVLVIGMISFAIGLAARHANALGHLQPVTKATQAKLGLEFNLTAERVSEEVVLVHVELPRRGKLARLRAVGMSLGKKAAFENGSPALSVPLQTDQRADGTWTARFQLTSEMASRCAVNLNVPIEAGQYVIYAVEVKGYIKDRE